MIWRENWVISTATNNKLVQNPNARVRLSCEVVICGGILIGYAPDTGGIVTQMLHKWIFKDSSACDCENGDQTFHHIVAECSPRKCIRKTKDIDPRNSHILYGIYLTYDSRGSDSETVYYKI